MCQLFPNKQFNYALYICEFTSTEKLTSVPMSHIDQLAYCDHHPLMDLDSSVLVYTRIKKELPCCLFLSQFYLCWQHQTIFHQLTITKHQHGDTQSNFKVHKCPHTGTSKLNLSHYAATQPSDTLRYLHLLNNLLNFLF